MTAPDPGLTDLLAAHWTWREVDEGGDYLVCECGSYFSTSRLWAAHVALVVEQHTNGRIASGLGADPQDYEIAWAAKLRWQARAEKAEATVARVNALAARRRESASTFYTSDHQTARDIRAALEGEQP